MPSSQTPIRLLGVDPGLNITGYGLLEIGDAGPTLLEAGIIRGKAKGSLTLRIQQIYRGLCDLIKSFQPTTMAIEQLYSHYQRPKTAILMGHARGVICLAGAEADVPILDYSATQIKKVLTGNGHAPKAQMQRAIQLELKLSSVPDPPDVADALAVALCHHHLGPTRQALAEAQRISERESRRNPLLR